jgi:hypothetical protein
MYIKLGKREWFHSLFNDIVIVVLHFLTPDIDAVRRVGISPRIAPSPHPEGHLLAAAGNDDAVIERILHRLYDLGVR